MQCYAQNENENVQFQYNNSFVDEIVYNTQKILLCKKAVLLNKEKYYMDPDYLVFLSSLYQNW